MRSGTIAFLLGVLAFQQLPDLPDPRWAGLLAVLLPVAAVSKHWRLPVVLAAGFLWGLLRATLILSHGIAPELEGRDVVVEGTVATIPVARERGLRFEFDVLALTAGDRPQPSPGRIQLSWYGTQAALGVGERWRLKVRLKRPRGFMNPGGFDYEGWLFQQRIRASGYVRKDPGNLRLGTQPQGHPVDRLRGHLQVAITGVLGDSANLGMVTALAVGERQGISVRQWGVLTRTGTNHLMAISGLHVGLVAGLVFFLVRRLWAWSGATVLYLPAPKAAAAAALLAAVAYAALAGFAIPTQRALIMLGVAMGAVLLQRGTLPSHSLALALLAVLVFDPFAVMAPGFWLSFAAVAVILLGMSGRLSRRRKPHAAESPMSVNAPGLWWKWGRVQWLVAVGLLPLTLVLFQRASLISPVANLVAVPWMSLSVIPLTLLGTALLSLIPAAGAALLHAADALLALLWVYLEWLSAFPIALWAQHTPRGWATACAVLGVALFLAPRGLPGRWLAGLWLLPLFLARPPGPAAGEVWFTLLDVGQGLAAVVRTANHTLVYDTGPRFSERFDTGRAVVVPFLRAAGVDRIDLLLVSHGDNDHIGGVRSILDELPVERLISGVPDRLVGTGAQPCGAEQSWNWDGVKFRIIHPPPGRLYKGNDGSCVLRVDNAAAAVLLPGDIEKSAERLLLDTRPKDLAAQILVAPHHGSNTSSTWAFLQAVGPRYVLFPVGYRNRFGFPKRQVTARYRELGASMLDTAQHGAISFRLPTVGTPVAPDTYRQTGRRYWNGH